MRDFLSKNRRLLSEQYDQLNDAALRGHDSFPNVHVRRFLRCLIVVFDKQESILSSAEPDAAVMAEIENDARTLGRRLVEDAGTADAIAHHFGDICQLITDLAMEQQEQFGVLDYQLLNQCLDAGIGGAIDGYNLCTGRRENDHLTEEHGHFLHELRNLLSAANLAFTLIQTGKVGHDGSTGKVLARSLGSMRDLLDRSLTRFKDGQGNCPAVRTQLRLSELVEEIAATVSTVYSGKPFNVVARFAPDTVFVADRESLLSALFNLIQNGFKFTCPGTAVTLTVDTTDDLLQFAVSDHCGGIPKAALESIFSSYVQSGGDRSGLGLGLKAVRKCIEEHGGMLRLKNMPGQGCVFLADIPIAASTQPAQCQRIPGAGVDPARSANVHAAPHHRNC